MTASKWPKWDWYEWDARFTDETDMIEKLEPEFAVIWLSLQWYDWDAKLTVDTKSQVCRIEKRKQKFFGRLSHICASLDQGVSVILVWTVSLASQSYHCKLWFKRLNHISLITKPRVWFISVSLGSFWRIHIRHPPIVQKVIEGDLPCYGIWKKTKFQCA